MFRLWKTPQSWNNLKTPLDKDTANFNSSPCTRKGYAGGFPFACAKTDRRASVWRRSLYGVCSALPQHPQEYAGGCAPPLRGDPSAVRG